MGVPRSLRGRTADVCRTPWLGRRTGGGNSGIGRRAGLGADARRVSGSGIHSGLWASGGRCGFGCRSRFDVGRNHRSGTGPIACCGLCLRTGLGVDGRSRCGASGKSRPGIRTRFRLGPGRSDRSQASGHSGVGLGAGRSGSGVGAGFGLLPSGDCPRLGGAVGFPLGGAVGFGVGLAVGSEVGGVVGFGPGARVRRRP